MNGWSNSGLVSVLLPRPIDATQNQHSQWRSLLARRLFTQTLEDDSNLPFRRETKMSQIDI
jgi:hypothetical protein